MDEPDSTPQAPDPTLEPAAQLPVLDADTAIPVVTDRPNNLMTEGNINLEVAPVAPAPSPDLPVIQVAPTSATEHSNILQNVGMSDSPPEAPQVVERIVEKIVEKEIPVEKIVERIVEKPVEVIKEIPVEKIVYKEAEPTDASLRAYLANFLRGVGPKGRSMQHERAMKKRDAVLKLFDTHEQVSHKLVMETLKFTDRDASRILATLCSEGKIVMHEPSAHHHGGRSTFYTKV